MYVYNNKCIYIMYMGFVIIFKKEILSKYKSFLILLFKIYISFLVGVKEKNFWFLGLLLLNVIFIVMFWINKLKLLFIFNFLCI